MIGPHTDCHKTSVFFLFLLCSCQVPLQAMLTNEHTVIEEHSKIATVDATPNDPGQVEFWNSYVIRGGQFAWKSDGGRKNRGTYESQTWNTLTTVGFYKNMDIGVIEGFQHTLDKENNYNEFKDMTDSFGNHVNDSTKGPSHGFGIEDLGLTGRWRFYDAEEKKLEISYIPTLYVPTGRRGNFDHLGASQGYTSLDNALAFTKDIGRWNGTVNLGYNTPLAHWERTRYYYGTAHVNFAAGYQWLRWLQPEVEVVSSHDFGGRGKTANLVSVVLGFVMPVSDHWRFETGVQQDVLGSNKIQTTSGIFSVAFLT